MNSESPSSVPWHASVALPTEESAQFSDAAESDSGLVGSLEATGRPFSQVLPGLSIVIPARDDTERLIPTLESYLPALQASGRQFEVLVVADGDDGKTPHAMTRYVGKGVRSLTFPKPLGKGGAILAGIRSAAYPHVAFLDADGPIPPRDLIKMADLLMEFDCVVASRRLPASHMVRPRRISRQVLSVGWNLLARALLSVQIKDTQCGAKVFKREALVATLPEVSIRSWAFDLDLLFHLARKGFRLKEVGVTWRDGPGSKLSMSRAVPEMFVSLVGIRIMSLPIGRWVPDRFVNWMTRRLNSG